MKLNKFTKTSIFCTILLISSFIPTFTLAQSPGNTTTRVNWDIIDDTFTNNWTWEDSSWEFGSKAKFRIEYLNGTEIDEAKEYIEINEEFVVHATIPDSIFKGRYNRSLGSVEIHWNMQVYDYENNDPTFMGAPLLSANLNLMYYAVHPSEIWDWYYDDSDIEYEEGWQWEVHSWQQNNTMGEGFEGSLSTDEYEYKPLPTRLKIAAEDPETAQEWQEPESFYTVNWDQCEAIYNNFTQTWEVEWVGQFNERVYLGTYSVSLSLYSNKGEHINLWGYSSWDWESDESPVKWIGVGELRVLDMWWGYSQWGIKTIDSAGKEKNTIGVEEEMTFRFNISKAIDPGFVYVSMNLPYEYSQTSVVEGWHQEDIAHTGGWVYNESSGTYNHNPNASFSTTENVYGFYEQESWASSWGQTSMMINISGWDWSSGEPVWSEWEQWVSNQLYLIYNQTTDKFAAKTGYEYWAANPSDPYAGGKMVFELSDVNASSEIENFFRLLSTNKYLDTKERTIIEFTGYFTDFMGTSEKTIWYNAGLFDVDGNQHWSDKSWGEIGLNQPQVNSWIVDSTDGKWNNQLYNMEPGEAFIIRNELIGPIDFWNSIDGVGFRLNCWDSQWTPEVNMWSQIEIYVTYNLKSGATTFEAYNCTSKQVWENSTYEDWVEVELEGCYWKYDETLGYDVWVNGTYKDWDWVEITDWHWQNYQFNQKTGEWVKGWLPWHSKETEIASGTAFVRINGASKYTTSEGTFIDLSITVLEGAPEAAYDWEVEFLKEEWGYDYNKPWGEYDSLQWIGKDIYYYEIDGEKYYLKDPQRENYVIINGTNYLVQEVPYVQIAGEIRPLKVSQYLDWSNQIQERIMNYEWDWRTGQQTYYYRDAETNKKITFYEGEKVNVYTVTLNNSGTSDTFQTFMNKPSQYWDETTNNQVYYFVDLKGNLHYTSAYTEWNEAGGDLICDPGNPNNNWTASNTYLRTINTTIDQIIPSSEARAWENRAFFVVLNGTTRLELSSQGIQNYGVEQYITIAGCVKYTVTNSEWNEQYGTDKCVTIEGKEYYISNSMEAYKVKYNGAKILIPLNYYGYHRNYNDYIGRYYFTIKNDQEYLLPYPGAIVNNRWEMEGTVTGLSQGDYKHYGVIPVLHCVNINGQLYVMENLTKTSGDFAIGSVSYKDWPIHVNLTTIFNGSVETDFTVIGESIPYGVDYYYYNFPFEKNGTLEVLPDQKLVSYRGDLSHFGVDNFYAKNGSFYLNLTDGSKINVRLNYTLPIFNVTVKYHDSITGKTKVVPGMKNLLSVYPYPYYSQSERYVPLLNGKLLKIPYNAWTEVVAEYSAYLNFTPRNIILNKTDYIWLYNESAGADYQYYFNWTEPYFGSETGQNSINFTFRNITYFYNDFISSRHRRIFEAKIDGAWRILMDPNYDWSTKEAKGWQKIYNLTVGTETYRVYMEDGFVQLYQTIWGYPYGLFLQRQEVLQVKTTHNLIFGTPRNNMWGYRMFTTTDEGALDLDGDLSTTDDQYFVYRTYESKDTFSHTRNVLELEIDYDPLTSVAGNEMHMRSSMGINKMNWTYEWSEEYTWFKADGTFSKVNSTEMVEIVDTVLDENNFTRPGYWEIDRMVRNRTWEDVLAEAEKYNWDWVLDNTHEWTWIEFNLDQNYWADFYADSSQEEIRSAFVTNRYEYAGLMLYKDDDQDGFMDIGLNSEITHFFVPSDVDSVSFFTPDVSNASDHYQEIREYWRFDGPYTKTIDVYTFTGAADIDWGVKFTNVNGTTYPFDNENYRSMWDWYDGVIDGSDFQSFADKPVEVTIDKLEFMVHFNGNSSSDGLYYNTEVKIDQWVGDWQPHIAGGRDNLENYSLSLTYYALSGRASMDFADTGDGSEPPGGETQIIDENNQPINNDNQTISESYSMVVDDANNVFAKAELGSPYTWSFDTSKELKVAVFTTPISTFTGAFMSESQQSCTSFNFEAELYFMSVGFPDWDGYEVYNDPTFQAYVGASAHSEGGSLFFIIVISGGIGGGIVISVVLIRIRKKKRQIIDFKSVDDSSIPEGEKEMQEEPNSNN